MIFAALAMLAASPTPTIVPSAPQCASESINEQHAQSVEALRDGIEACPWVQYYLLSAALMGRDEMEEAAFWFYVGQMRGRAYVRCHNPAPDGHPALLASMNSVLGEPVNQYLYGSLRRVVAVIDRALAWDAAHPDPALALPKCADAIAFVRNDKLEQRAWTISHADEIRRDRAEAGLPNEPE